MRPRKPEGSDRPDVAAKGQAYLPGSVDGGNWMQRAIGFMNVSGQTEFPVIRNRKGSLRDEKPETPEQWVAWMAFLKKIGVKYAFLKSEGVATVPADWPWEFSMDADPIRARIPAMLDVYEEMCRKSFPRKADNAERARAVEKYIDTRPQGMVVHGKTDARIVKAQAIAALDAMKKNGRSPVTLSDEIVQRIAERAVSREHG